MPIAVEHRKDRELVNRMSEGIEPRYTGEPIDGVTFLAYILIIRFLNLHLIDKDFKNDQTLQEALETWQNYAESNGFDFNTRRDKWGSLAISGDNVVVERESPDKPFVIGHIVRS